jgi:hypothetical protein
MLLPHCCKAGNSEYGVADCNLMMNRVRSHHLATCAGIVHRGAGVVHRGIKGSARVASPPPDLYEGSRPDRQARGCKLLGSMFERGSDDVALISSYNLKSGIAAAMPVALSRHIYGGPSAPGGRTMWFEPGRSTSHEKPAGAEKNFRGFLCPLQRGFSCEGNGNCRRKLLLQCLYPWWLGMPPS